MSDVIPLARFIPSSNSGRRQKEISASRDRKRLPVEESDDEESPLPIFASGKLEKAKPRLASQPAPLSDESDFDKDEEEEVAPKRGKKGRQSSKLDRKQGSRKGSLLLKEELEVADDDSQTFAAFKMRTAVQEEARIENERYYQQSIKGKTSQKRRSNASAENVIVVDTDEEDFAFERTKNKSSKSRSTQVSRRDDIAVPHISSYVGESVPYLDLKKSRHEVEEEEEAVEAEEEVVIADPKATSHRTLLDLLLEKPPQPSKPVDGASHSQSSAEDSDHDVDKPSQKHKKANPGDTAPLSPVDPTNETADKATTDELSDDDDMYFDDDQLVFDTEIGKLIRPIPSSSRKSPSVPQLEEGQSEEEDGYQPTIVDEKPPKKGSSYWDLYQVKRSRIIVEENLKAEEEAKELGMRPSFKCSAAKQRKKPYGLDPFDRKMVIPVPINRFLRRYQRTGVQFFYDRYKGIKVDGIGIVKGGILGDDMGLGKTIQVLAFLSAIRGKTGTADDNTDRLSRKGRVRSRQGDCGPKTFGPTCLITCPKTLVTNWKREIETWTYLELGVIDSKRECNEVIAKYKNGFLDIVLIPFDRLVSEIDRLSSLEFSIMIIDEAHSIKNPNADRTEAMKKIRADCRFAMTGTLVQNRFQEMWSVLDFVVPGLVGTHKQWQSVMAKKVDRGMDQNATVADVYDKRQITDALHKNLLPLLFLRRTKAAVALELPQKNDHVVFCPLTPTGELVYKRLAAQPDLREYLERNTPTPCPNHPEHNAKDCCYPSDDREADKGLFLRYISVFRKVSNHIGLIYSQPDDSPEQKELCQRLMDICFPPSREAQEQQIGLIDRDKAEDYIRKDAAVIPEELRPTEGDTFYRNLRSYEAATLSDLSGKWVVLNCLLRLWKDDDKGRHKVLIFSTSVKLLKMLQGFIQLEHNCEILHGGVKDEERMAAVDRFQTDPNVFVFLISTLAGGVGLNLTAANKVVIFDPNWNPAHDLQAMDRAFRMGQKRDVDVYRLISLGTIEEIIYERQMRKSAAMRIIYENAIDSRAYEGHEAKGVTGDLWGIRNLLTFEPEGTSLQRAAKLLSEETEVEKNLGGVLPLIKSLRVETTYEDETERHVVGTERGTELESVNEDATLLEALGDFIPGLRRENVKKTAAQPSAVERFIQEQAVEDYHKNPSARHVRANDHYRDPNVAKQTRKRKPSQRVDEETETGTSYKAPRLTLQKSERVMGLVSDDEE